MNESDRTIVHQIHLTQIEGMGTFFEVDGDTYFMAVQMAYDAARTAWLEEQGCQVVRFSNKDIVNSYNEQ